MSTPEWKKKEHIVTLIETALKPYAKVEHNKFLQDLTGDGDKRQCDVVVTYGHPPNTIMQIIEVQDRATPLELVVFDGFVTKMETVGAQQLICVTREPYSNTIINRAKRYGPKVQLYTLDDVESERFPIKSMLKYKLKRKIDLIKLGKSKIEVPRNIQKKEVSFDSNDKVFIYRKKRSSLAQLIQHFINHTNPYIKSGSHIINFDSRRLSSGLIYSHDGITCPIILSFDINIFVKSTEIPLLISEYQRVDDNEDSAWLVTYKGEFEGEPLLEKETYTPLGDGKYKVTFWMTPEQLDKGVSAIIERDKLTQITSVLEDDL